MANKWIRRHQTQSTALSSRAGDKNTQQNRGGKSVHLIEMGTGSITAWPVHPKSSTKALFVINAQEKTKSIVRSQKSYIIWLGLYKFG